MELSLLPQFLVFSGTLKNAGRASLVAGLTVEAYKRKKFNENEMLYSVEVLRHKTTHVYGSAFMSMDLNMAKEMNGYLETVR